MFKNVFLKIVDGLWGTPELFNEIQSIWKKKKKQRKKQEKQQQNKYKNKHNLKRPHRTNKVQDVTKCS